MLWSRVILVLSLTVISVRPELSLEEIEKELEQLSAKANDAGVATKTETSSTSTKSDTEKAQSEPAKELSDKSHETSEEELKALEKSVADTKTKTDETEKKTTQDSTKPVVPDAPIPVKPALDDSYGPPGTKPIKPAPVEIPDRDASAGARNSLLKRLVPRPRFEDTPAYRRILEAEALNRLPEFSSRSAPRFEDTPAYRRIQDAEALNRLPEFSSRSAPRGYYSYDRLQPAPKPYWHDAPVRGMDSPWIDSPVSPYRRTGMDMTRAERMSAGSWVEGDKPVRVPARIPALPLPAVDARSFNGVHQQMDYKSIDDLVRGKSGLTQTEMRKRYLMDLLAEKLKRKVNEAQKRGIKVPDKIMDYLWNYESRKSLNAQPVKPAPEEMVV